MIRPSIESDKSFLLTLFQEEGVLSGFPMTTPAEIEDSCNFWMDMALRGYGITFEAKGQVAGMAVLYIPIYKKLSKAALFSIVVKDTFRRQKIGSKLISTLEHIGKKMYGLSIIHLEVYEKNEAAISLYKNLGYTIYGVQEKFIKENGIYSNKVLMEKRI